MAGADADDALLVLTAVLLTPARFPGVLGDDYVAACGALAIEPYEQGYGLVLGQDGDGARWTVVVDDVSLVAVAIAAWDCGMAYDLSPDERSVVCALPGWPLALAVAAPGVPAPHDPETDGEGPAPLAPPTRTPGAPRNGGSGRTRSRSGGRCGGSRSTIRSPARRSTSAPPRAPARGSEDGSGGEARG